MLLGSGNRVAKFEILTRIVKLLASRPERLPELRSWIENAQARHGIVHKESVTIDGPLHLDHTTFKPPLAAIAVLGDLTINGAFTANYCDTLLFVQGDLRAERIECGTLPLLVLGKTHGAAPKPAPRIVEPLRAEFHRAADTTGPIIDGDLILDGEDLHYKGSLTVNGDIVNDNLDAGAALHVAGDLRVRNLRKGGSTITIGGSLEASGVVVAEYNHGVFRVGGDLNAQLYLVMDHDSHVAGLVKAHTVDTDIDDLRDHFVDEAFDDHGDLTGERVHALARMGRLYLL